MCDEARPAAVRPRLDVTRSQRPTRTHPHTSKHIRASSLTGAAGLADPSPRHHSAAMFCRALPEGACHISATTAFSSLWMGLSWPAFHAVLSIGNVAIVMRNPSPPFVFDLDDCKRAALHLTPSIQGSGALLAVDADSQTVVACSQNLAQWLGVRPDEALGQPAGQVLGDAWTQLLPLAADEGKHQLANLPLPGSDICRTVVAHRCGAHLIYEIWPQSLMPAWWNLAARALFMEKLAATSRAEDCIALLVETVATHTGLDRVMAYRFLPNWDGEVVHEACRPGVESFLGLRFPASDLPANARALYTLNWHRAITDLAPATSPLCYTDACTTPLDLTYSTLRAVHPTHIRYLQNMGVAGSLSLSLVVEGKLWGLIACHHMQTPALSIHVRFALEEMARLVALHLTNLLNRVHLLREAHLREAILHIRETLQGAGDYPASALASMLPRLMNLFAADGAVLHLDGQNHLAGLVPENEAIAALHAWLGTLPHSGCHHYTTLPATLRPHPGLARYASGLLALTLDAHNTLLLFRQEVVHTINWAGNPRLAGDDTDQPLTPRHSFALWSEKVRHSATPWDTVELTHAHTLRKVLADSISLLQLEKIALRDPLTGLANRREFERQLHKASSRAITQGKQLAVHMLDLDHFKPVNDSLGHAAGDALLEEVATRLRHIVRSHDTVARLGGDEFAIIQTEIAGSEAARALAERVVHVLSQPYTLRSLTLEISASIGVALFPTDTGDKDELLRLADTALYTVKNTGRGTYALHRTRPEAG